MFNGSRVCIPLTMDCNLHCIYCFRNIERIEKVPDFSPLMVKFLQSLSPDSCEAVVVTGGETLLHFDKVKECFSYVPKDVHKKILSNGTLLTQEIVDYINNNDIELAISHDGPMTKRLRGVDILNNENLVRLIRQVKYLRLFSVVTKYNPNVWENFFDTIKKMGRTDFEYHSFPLTDIPCGHDLIEGFDYELWSKTWLEFLVSPYRKKLPWYDGKTLKKKLDFSVGGPFVAYNFLPDGTICDMYNIRSVFGNVTNTIKECKEKAIAQGYFNYCHKVNCPYFGHCTYKTVCTSEHMRKCRSLVMDFWKHDNIVSLRKYVNEHMTEIESKYGYTKGRL